MNPLKRIFSPEEFTGWHMLGIMGVFFGTIISVNMFLAFSAGTSWTGLVVQNTYVESQKFNSRTSAYEEQAALGWKAEPVYKSGVFSVRLLDDGGKPIAGATVTAKIGRPVHEGDDRTVALTAGADGHYQVQTELGLGIWDAELDVISADGEIWRRILRIELKG